MPWSAAEQAHLAHLKYCRCNIRADQDQMADLPVVAFVSVADCLLVIWCP